MTRGELAALLAALALLAGAGGCYVDGALRRRTAHWDRLPPAHCHQAADWREGIGGMECYPLRGPSLALGERLADIAAFPGTGLGLLHNLMAHHRASVRARPREAPGPGGALWAAEAQMVLEDNRGPFPIRD